MERNQSLNDFFYQIAQEGPQKQTYKMPSDLGIGKVVQVKTKKGCIVSEWDMVYREDVYVQASNSEEYFQIIFCFQDEIAWRRRNEEKLIALSCNELCAYCTSLENEAVGYKKNKSYHFKSVKIPISFLNTILEEYFSESEIEQLKEELYHKITKRTISPELLNLLDEIMHYPKYYGSAGFLFLDSKIMELMAQFINGILCCEVKQIEYQGMSKEDVEAILEAKQMIDRQLAYAPTCEELAKKVGMGLSKFKKGFTQIVGMPVHTYVIDQRLEKSAKLLLKGQNTIGEIASIVGYSNLGHFSAAFKKKYGILPKKYSVKNKSKNCFE